MRYCYIYAELVDFLEDNKDNKSLKTELLSLVQKCAAAKFDIFSEGCVALGNLLKNKGIAINGYVRGGMNIREVCEEIKRAYVA